MIQLIRPIVRGFLIKGAAAVLLALLGLWGIGFLLFAAYLEARSFIDPPSLAALAVGTATLLASGLSLWLLFTGRRLLRRRRRSGRLFEAIDLDAVLRRRPTASVALALAAGTLLGLSPGARRAALVLLILGSDGR